MGVMKQSPRSVERSSPPNPAASHSAAAFHAAQDGLWALFAHPGPAAPVRRCSYWETSYSSCESKGHHLRRCTGQLFQRGVAGRERKMACHPLRTFIRWDSERGPQQFGERGMRRRESRVVEAERHADSRQRWELGREADLRPCPSLPALLEDEAEGAVEPASLAQHRD